MHESYWAHIEASFERLVHGALAAESKLHILHGEFLEGAGRSEEARAAFCRAYIATGSGAAAAHAQQFLQDGVAALSRPEGPDLRTAEQYFSMAVRAAARPPWPCVLAWRCPNTLCLRAVPYSLLFSTCA